jgi:hypothetical protein
VGDNLLQVRGHKHKVYAAKAKLGDAQKYVDQAPEMETK